MPITGKTRIVGVFGSPVTHSRSPIMHNRALEILGLDWAYVPYTVHPDDIGDALRGVRALNLIGVNVTVPLKECVAEHLDWIDPAASKINSINTIVNVDGRLCGYSTDGPGFLWDLADKSALPAVGSTVLVLGAGGSARAVVWSLFEAGYRVVVCNRTLERAERLAEDLDVGLTVVPWRSGVMEDAAHECALIVNTTTVGMSGGDAESSSIFAQDVLSESSVVYDLVYAPPVTRLMEQVRAVGGIGINGLGMLVRQGAFSLSLWTGRTRTEIPVAEMEEVLG